MYFLRSDNTIDKLAMRKISFKAKKKRKEKMDQFREVRVMYNDGSAVFQRFYDV